MNAAVKKQRVLPVNEIISDAMLDVTDSGSTLDHIEQYVIVCCFRMKFGSSGSKTFFMCCCSDLSVMWI